MKRLLVGLMAGLVVAALTGTVFVPQAAADLTSKLVEKGVITEAEAAELRKESSSGQHKPSFSWFADEERFKLQMYGYGQVRYTFQDFETKDNDSNFSVQRARLGIRGHAFSKAFRYQMFLNVSGDGQRDVAMFDYFIDYVPAAEFGVRLGQYKVPYGLQWTTSASKLQFVDRTTVDGNFRLDRDTGVMLHGKLMGMLSYDFAVMNGGGTNTANGSDKHLWVGRLALTPLGKYPGGESDMGLSADPRLFASLSAAQNEDATSHSRKNLNGQLSTLGESDVKSYGAALGFKWKGASVTAEGHRRTIEPSAQGVEDITAQGAYLQAGYFVWKDVVEVAIRSEVFDPDVDTGDDLHQEYGLALNWHLNGHRNKIQSDFFRLHNQKGSTSTDDDRLRIQYQLAF